MSPTQRRDEHDFTAAARSCRRSHGILARASVAVVITAGLAQAATGVAAPLDAAPHGALRFEPLAGPTPPALQARLPGATGPILAAASPNGVLYGTTDPAGKARVWLLRNNALVAELTATGSREHMHADWSGSFAFWLGALPVAALSWKFGQDAYGIEDFGFWAVEGNGRFLGGLPGSTRSACAGGEAPGKDCVRCTAASGIPIDLKLAALEPGRARFVQVRAATWYYYFGGAAELFEQDFMLSTTGLVPEGQARRVRGTVPLVQVQERVKSLLRDYFRLAKSQSRAAIAPEFLSCFEQAAALAPDFGQAHYNVGCMHALLGNHKEAVAATVRALTLEPKYRKLARKDPDLASVRDDPELLRVLGDK